MENNVWVDLTISRGPIRGKNRNKVGLILKIKARPELEDLMSSLSNGRKSPLDAVVDSWHNCNSEGIPLEYYDAELPQETGQAYTLNALGGQPLISTNRERDLDGLRRTSATVEQVNLSFLRLVGISNENGVSIGISGAYSWEYVKRLRSAIPPVLREFLQNYLVEVNLNFVVISKQKTE